VNAAAGCKKVQFVIEDNKSNPIEAASAVDQER